LDPPSFRGAIRRAIPAGGRRCEYARDPRLIFRKAAIDCSA
jgi:hypothetical protein